MGGCGRDYLGSQPLSFTDRTISNFASLRGPSAVCYHTLLGDWFQRNALGLRQVSESMRSPSQSHVNGLASAEIEDCQLIQLSPAQPLDLMRTTGSKLGFGISRHQLHSTIGFIVS
jgi:hypothetical protein